MLRNDWPLGTGAVEETQPRPKQKRGKIPWLLLFSTSICHNSPEATCQVALGNADPEIQAELKKDGDDSESK